MRAGQIVLVHGASGGVGLAAVQLAAATGAHVIGTAGTERGMQLVKDNGAALALNHREEGYMAAVREFADLKNNNNGSGKEGSGGGVDIVVEMLANVNLDADLKVLARGGTVAVVGNRDTIEINPRDLMAKESSILGVLGGTPEEHKAAFAAINAGLERGFLVPVVDRSFNFGLADAPKAHEEVIAHSHGSAGKIVLLPFQ